MRLQSKMIAIVGVILIVTILVWVFVAETLYMNNYQQLERADVQNALDATRYSLGRSINEINASARDYAAWDDTYSFVVNNNTNYTSDNLVGTTFENLRLNFILIENTDGKIVFANAYDLVNSSFVALPSDVARLASTSSPLFFHNESAGTSTGVLYTASGPLLIASQPILTSVGTGPIHGTLMFGRYLTPDVIEAIAGPEKAVSVYPFGAQSPDNVQRVQPALAGGAASVIEPVNTTTVAGFTLLRDVYGNPSLVIEEVLPRTIYQAGLSSTNTFLGLLVISGVISLTCMVWALRQSVLAPLLRINTSLARIRTSDDLSKRVPERGDVELVWLARAINATLASLESSHAERDAADNALRSSEQRFRAVAESAADAIVTADQRGVIAYWNAAAQTMFGYTASEVQGKPITAIFSDEFGNAYLEAATLRSASVEQEYLVKRKDGTLVPIEPRLSVWETRDGEFVTAIIRDITERKLAEQKLRESERRVRELTDALPEIIFETDANGIVTFANATPFTHYGYAKEEVEGKMNFLDVVAPFDRERAIENLSRIIQGEDRGWLEYDLIKKDGGSAPWAVRAIPIVRDGVYEGFRGIAIDITERKRAEAALITSERHIRELTDTLPVVVYEADETSRVTFVNATIFDLFGYTKEELEAGMSILQLVTDADQERARTMFRRRMGDHDIGRMEYTGRRKDGSTFPISVRGAPIRRDGAVVGVRGIIVDITERKQAEERVEEHTHTIEILNLIVTEGSRATDVQSFAEAATNLTLELIYFDAGTIHLVDADARCANLRYATGIPGTAVEAIREIPLDETPYARFLVEPKPLFVDGHEALRVPHVAELGLKSLAVVPLYRYDEVIGALTFGSFKHRTFSQAEKDLLIAIGNEVGTVITKLQADEALKESDRRIRELTDALSEIIFETDANGTVTFANETPFTQYGYTKGEIEGKMNLLDFVAPFDRERARETIRKRIQGEDMGWAEYALIKKDGSTAPFDVRTMPIVRDGVYEGLRGIGIDITERKRDEQKLRESDRRIREITDALPVVVYEADETGLLTFVNATVFDLFGYTKAELEAGMSIFQLITDADQERARAVFRRRMSGEDVGRIEYTGRRRDGSTLPIAIRAALMKQDAAVVGQRGVILDVTELKRAEDEIKASLKERETLLKEIHHRVKNNMQVVSSLLSLQAAQATEPETIETLNESQRQIRSMALIHEKLYRSSSLAEIDFGDYVKSLIAELLRMYNVPPGVITITADIENVQLGVDTAIPCALIINELVSNSLKHAFPDGRTGGVTVALQRANGAYTLTVADDGVGFPADVDFRATDSLGMQLVVTLVNQLEGTITLDRTKGTTFVITFKPAGAY